jgi:hypothetical protein
MVTVQVNVSDNASPALAALISALTGPQAAKLSEQGGIGARDAAAKYHREFDKSNGWRGTRYLGAGKNDGSNFGSDVARAWALESFTSGGAVITNDAPFYRHKVTGGTLTPKRAKFLTIPLIPEAKGIRAAVYQQNSGNRLFRPKGKNVLMESTGNGGIRAVYALVKSITQGPWPNALPPLEDIAAAYTDQYRKQLLKKINL